VSPCGRGGILAGGGTGCHVGTPTTLHLQYVCVFFAVPWWEERQLLLWFSPTTTGSHSITALTLECPWNTMPPLYSYLVLAMLPDRHIWSGSAPTPNHW
jgi:hypothetical protein